MGDERTPPRGWRQTWPLRAASGIEVVGSVEEPELWVVYGGFATNLPQGSSDDPQDNTALLNDPLYDWVVEEVWRLTGDGRQYPDLG
jgi:hypothetical protein